MQLILEDLPDEFAKVVESYNREVTDIFSQYPATVAKWLGEGRGENHKLPLSGIGKKYLMHILVRIILHFLEPEYIFREYVIPVKRFHAVLCVVSTQNGTRGAGQSDTNVINTFWRHLWPVTENMHSNLESISFNNLLVCPPIDHM